MTGKLIPGITEIRILNNNARNLQIKKIFQQDKSEFVLIKIQLKDEIIGKKFFDEVEKKIKK